MVVLLVVNDDDDCNDDDDDDDHDDGNDDDDGDGNDDDGNDDDHTKWITRTISRYVCKTQPYDKIFPIGYLLHQLWNTQQSTV